MYRYARWRTNVKANPRLQFPNAELPPGAIFIELAMWAPSDTPKTGDTV